MSAMINEDNGTDGPWDLAELREWVAGLGKSLIQARRHSDPSYAWPPVELERWKIATLDGTARQHLRYAIRNLGRLKSSGVLPEHWRSSATPTAGPPHVGQLVERLEHLFVLQDPDDEDEDPVAALERAVDKLTSEPKSWISLISWDELAPIRTVLTEHFPEVRHRPATVRPRWDKSAGTLSYRGQVIRKVVPKAKNVRKLLDVFEEDTWEMRIDSPFLADTEVLLETLKTLRKGLKAITFVGDGSGEGVCWRPKS